MTYGQGHCHGLSSTMAAMLQPFAAVLGIDVAYRSGWVHPVGPDGVPPPTAAANGTVDRHHWLEVTYRPFMHATTCDLSFEAAYAADFPEEKEKGKGKQRRDGSTTTTAAAAAAASGGAAAAGGFSDVVCALAVPITLAYSRRGGAYPNGNALAFCSPAAATPSDLGTSKK